MSTSTATIDYLSKDYEALRESMLAHASRVMPAWQNRSEGDFGVTLIELMAYTGDILSYYGDRIQQEAYLPTATQRASLLQIASLLGYIPSNGVPAVGTVTLQTANPGSAVVVPAGTQLTTDYITDIDGSIIYETDAAVTVPANGGTAVATVTQGVTYSNVVVGISDGTPSQRFRLPYTDVINGSVRVFVDDTSVNGAATTSEWIYYPFLVDADGGDAAFSTFVDDTGVTWVEFGDGVNGMAPNTGLNVYATLRVGSGKAGNVSAGLVSMIASTSVSGVAVALDTAGTPITSAMTGGADAESTEQIRANAPKVFRTQDRAVTTQDFADLALAVPGVLRASALAGTYTSVSVYIVGPGGTTPSTALLTSVNTALTAKALAGCSVTVAGPSIIPVNVGTVGTPVAVQVVANYKQAVVAKAVDTAIRNLLSFANVDFGVRLTLSDFYAAIMSVPGVQYVSIPMVARSDAAQTGTADMLFRTWEIPSVGTISLVSSGGLT